MRTVTSLIIVLLITVLIVVWLAQPLVHAQAQNGPTTIRVSVASDESEANHISCCPFISADGRYVAFQSLAANLVPVDANGTFDIFVRDLQRGETTRVSVASDGTEGNGYSGGFSMSADGRYVAFESEANNLVAEDINREQDIFVHDRETGATTRVSVASDGTEANGGSDTPSISADGRFVAFTSWATTLVPDDTNTDCYLDPTCEGVFVHDRQTGETTHVSVSSEGTPGNADSYSASISADGRYVAFESEATNLVADDTNYDFEDIFVHDRETGATTRVSLASDGTQGNAPSKRAAISADGSHVAFTSFASNLVLSDTNDFCPNNEYWDNCGDVFVHDRATGETTRVSVASDGSEGNSNSNANYGPPGISADGRYVAFTSAATNLVPGDANRHIDVFVHDREARATSLISVASDGNQSNATSLGSSISGDGRLVAFFSSADNLVPEDSNETDDVFVRIRAPLVAPTPTRSPTATAPTATTTTTTTPTPSTTSSATAITTRSPTREATATTTGTATEGLGEHRLYLPLLLCSRD